MTLMSNRCTSARAEEGILFSDREPPFGIHIPQYFYVQQSKPAPMAPLKVWRGYKGNVYFEPISIHRVNTRPDSSSHHLDRVASEQARYSASASQPHTCAPTRATTAGQSVKSYRFISSSPQVYVMDKQAVISSVNSKVQDELKCIEEMESTGSLAVRPYSSGAPLRSPRTTNEKRVLYRRDKICKGPNFHVNAKPSPDIKPGKQGPSESRRSSYASSKFSQRKQLSYSAGHTYGSRSRSRSSMIADPILVINGDKFAPPTVMSPLLRSTSQFSRGNQRAAMNTPDILGVYDKLPPVHVSLHHIM